MNSSARRRKFRT